MEAQKDQFKRAAIWATESGFGRSLRGWYRDLRPTIESDEVGQYLIGPDIRCFYEKGARSQLDQLDFIDALRTTIRERTLPRSQLLQDVAALAFSDARKTFLEIGGGHPRDHSNTFMLEQNFGWRGVVAEPNPEFAELYRQFRPKLSRLVQACVVPSTFNRARAELVQARELSQVIGLDSKVPDGHQALRDSFRRAGKIISVPVVRPPELWNLVFDSFPEGIAFLSVDIEGAELEILEESPLSDEKSPSFITVETSDERGREQQVTQIMRDNGYRPVMPECSKWDRWFLKETEANSSKKIQE